MSHQGPYFHLGIPKVSTADLGIPKVQWHFQDSSMEYILVFHFCSHSFKKIRHAQTWPFLGHNLPRPPFVTLDIWPRRAAFMPIFSVLWAHVTLDIWPRRAAFLPVFSVLWAHATLDFGPSHLPRLLPIARMATRTEPKNIY